MATRPNLPTLLSLVATLGLLASCARPPEPTGPALDPVIRTTFYPTTYFARRLADGLITVENPAPPQADPATWRPTPDAIAAYQRATLIVTNGAEFERWAITAPIPRSRLVETVNPTDIPGGLITIKGLTHSHGPAGQHSHDGLDGHTWLEPTIAIAQATRLADAMAQAFPAHATQVRANLPALVADLTALAQRLDALTPAARRATLLASHPSFNYLARARGWTITNLDLDPDAPAHPDTTPQPEANRAIAQALAALAPRGRVIMLWESAPIDETASALSRDLGIASVLFSPAETAPNDGDYLTVMHANIDRLERALTAD